MALTKNVLLRMDPAIAAELQVIADVEGRPRSEVLREALEMLIEARRTDRSFQRRLEATARTQADVLRTLRADER